MPQELRHRPSTMKHQFSEVPKAEIPRSSFDRSHGLKTTFDGGLLIPILADEALPGDTFNLKMTAFARLNTPIFPVMDNLFMDTFYFAVPTRILWDNWERFNGAQDNPGDSTDFTVPQMTTAGPILDESLDDYLGWPTNLVNPVTGNVLHHRAYNLIFNEWFRDQNLQDSVPINTGDGPDAPTDYKLVRRGKRHDYFTSCLPFPQKGAAVSLPLGTSAPVVPSSAESPPTFAQPASSGGTPYGALQGTDLAGLLNVTTTTAGSIPLDNLVWDQPRLQTDLTGATAVTVNTLREAFQVQRLLERDARGGTRYTEVIKAHFGVTSPDSRMQRPEFLGGGSTPVNITPIASTVPSSLGGGVPQGTLAAMGTATLANHGFTKSFTEHCVIIGLVSVRADLTYQQGLHRMYSRQTRYDYFWPVFSHLGEQEVLNSEIFYQGTPTDQNVFGYQERYAEYRYKNSQVTGKFRSSDPATLDAWHLAQDFQTLPVLDDVFIEDNPPIDRIVAVPAEPAFTFDSYFSMRCARPMPLYGVPGLIDHF